ncbi:MAG: amidohydrolase family protein [Pseudomonadota bacterium]
MRKLLTPILLVLAAPFAVAQETITPNDIADDRSGAYAFTNATATVAPGETIEDATILIRDGRVESVEAAGAVPAGYAEMDLTGRHVYPGLIDMYSAYGVPAPARPAPFSFNQPEVIEPQRPGAYNANDAIRSDHRAADVFAADPKGAEAWRGMGFAATMTFTADGIARGTGALVNLTSDSDNEALIKSDAAALYSFSKGSSKQSYPISPMGAIALVRQTQYDARWYQAQSPKPFTDQALDAWIANRGLPQIFEVDNWMEALRADATGDEFDVQYVIKGGGDEYQRIDAIKDTGAALIVPVDFPGAEDVADPLAANRISLEELKHWELAPGNLAAIEAADITFAITSGGDTKNFHKNLRKAIERGLSEEAALAALTTTPATLLGAGEDLGRITAGSHANLLITSGPLFAEDTVIQENWIAGTRHVLAVAPEDFAGRYELMVGDASWTLDISGDPGKQKGEIVLPEMPETEAEAADEDAEGGDKAPKKPETLKVDVKFDEGGVSIAFAPEKDADKIRLTGWTVANRWSGRGQLGDGAWTAWTARRAGDVPEPEKDGAEGDQKMAGKPGDAEGDAPSGDEQMAGKPGDAEDKSAESYGDIIYPFVAYGTSEKASAEDVLIRGATVWTMEDEGVLENADVLIRDGKIAAVGQELSAGSARVIDAAGMHVTPGIIDEHSHIALSGVNDVAMNSGMVRMGDVVNSEDVNIYRNLAGGVTAAQLLHGSANPVGGQSALIKMRWGSLPSEMLIDDAAGYIKFALGENVKRSRNAASIRFPQSRMGVEAAYRAAFTEAQAYRSAWDEWNDLSRREKSRTPAPRRDLVLDAMAEILAGERFISCHSYVQSEINMLMKVAEDFDFRINTFTHILEGYKVADKMAAHGAGGSSFADWWAYKWEVRYAIPYNPALMHQAGVVSAINSDSAEMSRRLNQEAAKSVKYGGVSEIDALAMVTLNPAKLLRLDDRMGSLKVGKDADVVIWNEHPLSIDASPETTFVDGVALYDRRRDAELREALEDERARLVAKMAKDGGGKGSGGAKRPWGHAHQVWECESIHGYEHALGISAH